MKLSAIFLICSAITSSCAINSPWNDNGNLFQGSHTAITDCTNNITIVYWWNRYAGINGNSILEKGDRVAANDQFFVRDSGGGLQKVDFVRSNGSGGDALWRSDGALSTTNTWVMMAFTFTYTDSNSFRCYINGTNFPGVWINTPVNISGNSNSAPLRLGGSSAGTAPLSRFSDLTLWNSVLTQPQVNLIFQSKVKGVQKQINTSTLKLYWPLDSLSFGKLAVASTRWQDRPRIFEPNVVIAENVTGTHDPIGDGEKVCSYPPNE